MDIYNWFCHLICTITLIKFTESCSCPNKKHLQVSMCTANFAIQAVVSGEREVLIDESGQRDLSNIFGHITRRPEETWKYPITVLSIFKSSEEFEMVNKRYIYTSGPPSTCGVNLIKGRKYLLTGSVLDGQLTIHLCDTHSAWFDLTWRQKRLLRKDKYTSNCACGINDCVFPNSCPLNPVSMDVPGTECILEDSKADCLNSFSYCKQTAKGCLWKSNKATNSCLEL